MSVPGLKVVAPSTPADAYGLLATALREDGPVVYVDHKRLFPGAGDVPVDAHDVPFGRAAIRRAGSNVTIATHSYMTRVALDAAGALAAQDIDCEVIDLRSLSPLDIDTLCASVARTGALLTLEEGQPTCGVGVEVAARVHETLGRSARGQRLKSARLGALPAPVSSNPVLEAACLPDAVRVVHAVTTLLA
jgi:pyruvate dehydrogenase E1 component beta subunit